MKENLKDLLILIGNLPAMVFRCNNDKDYTMSFASEHCYEITGYTPSALVENHDTSYGKLIHPDHRERVWITKQNFLKEKKKFDIEYCIITASDVQKWVREQGSGVFSEAGELVYLDGYITDITDRRQADKDAIRTSSELQERLKELNCLYEILGHVHDENKPWQDMVEPILESITKAFQFPNICCARILLANEEYRTRNFKKTRWYLRNDIYVNGKHNGCLEIYYLEKRPLLDEGPFFKEERQLIDAIGERLGRIIESKLSTQALLKSEKRFRKLVEDLPIGVSIVQGDIAVYRNPEQKKLMGNAPTTVWAATGPKVHPDDLEKTKAVYEKMRTGKLEKESVDFRILLPDSENGGRVSMRRISAQATKIDYNNKESVLGTWLDTTEAMEFEKLARVEDKMASLGRVTAGIAHEIRNPLSGINIYLNTLENVYRKKDSLETIEKIIGQMKIASDRIDSVIQKTMDFAKPSEPAFSLINLNEPIADALGMTSVLLRKNGIETETHLCEDLPLCRGDRRMLSQVILNLIVNATDAMKNSTAPKKIAIRSASLEEYIEISVADSGLGVPEHLREKIFEPFFSDTLGGTGIGLSLSHRIMTDHGGTLCVTSSEWNGAKFCIRLPTLQG